MKNKQLICRFIKEGEEDGLYLLILRSFHQYIAPTYSADGVKTFLNMLSADFLKETEPKKFTIVAERDGRPAGVLTSINEGHIALLFVDSEFKGQGIGTALIAFCTEVCRERYPRLSALTVSSSPNSLPFYEKNGFVRICEEQDENGLRFTPMQKEIAARNQQIQRSS